MTRGYLRPRRLEVAAAFAGAIVGLLVALLPADPASAHAVLQRTDPIADSVVPTPPVEVVLTFSEPVSVVPGRVRVIGPDGARADRGEQVVRGGVVAIHMRSDLPPGTYLVNYRAVSADGHPVAGGFTYSVGAPTAAPAAVEEDGGDSVVWIAIPVAKYVGYLGLVLIAGPALVLMALWPRRLSRRAPTRLAWLGLGLTGLSTVAGLMLQAPYTAGTSLTQISGASLREVLSTTVGTAHVVRLGVLAAAAFLLRPVLAGRGGTTDRALLGVLALVGLATWPLAGHSATSPMRAVTVLADVAHLAGMAVWLGGLVMLLGVLLPLATANELDAILPVWSRWAAVAVSALLLAGTVQAVIEVGTPSALVTTDYGWLVIVKVALFAGVVGVAAFSRRLVRRRTAADQPGRLRRLVGVELSVAAVVLAVAAFLVQTTPARTAGASGADLADAQLYTTTLNSELVSLKVDVDPAETGNNSVHLYAYQAGRPVQVVEWRASAALPAAGVEPMQVALLTITDNHAVGQVSLPVAGEWTFRFTLRLSEVDQATVATTVPIR